MEEVLGIYPQACRFLRLPHHHIHSSYEKSIIWKENNSVYKKSYFLFCSFFLIACILVLGCVFVYLGNINDYIVFIVIFLHLMIHGTKKLLMISGTILVILFVSSTIINSSILPMSIQTPKALAAGDKEDEETAYL